MNLSANMGTFNASDSTGRSKRKLYASITVGEMQPNPLYTVNFVAGIQTENLCNKVNQ